jgi:hypothetical protein
MSGQLDNVDAQVLQMLSAWKGVEDGGRSLQEASEKLLEEKVNYVHKHRSACLIIITGPPSEGD